MYCVLHFDDRNVSKMIIMLHMTHEQIVPKFTRNHTILSGTSSRFSLLLVFKYTGFKIRPNIALWIKMFAVISHTGFTFVFFSNFPRFFK